MASGSLWLYRVLLALVLPVVVPVLRLRDRITGKRRPPFSERMARRLPDLERDGLWIQAVSVGEVEVARRLVAELERRSSPPPVLLTATTATGLELARRSLGSRSKVLPCPLDLPGPVGRVLDTARPRAVVLVETELWPELIHQAARRGIPVAVVNGRLSDASFGRYRRIRGLIRPLLEPLELVLARDESDAERFVRLGVPVDRVHVAGNVKYDLEADPTPLEWEETAIRLAGSRPLLVAGSTMEGEEEQVLEAVAQLPEPPFLVLAPRHPERFDAVAASLQQRGVRFVRRSWFDEAPEKADALLIDTIGELGRAFKLGAIAFIGGSLAATGGHNPLEPAVWGVPVLTGPHVFNFQEVYDEMLAAGGARMVDDVGQLATALAAWLDDPAAARKAGAAGRAVVEQNRGATARTIDTLLGLVQREESSRS